MQSFEHASDMICRRSQSCKDRGVAWCVQQGPNLVRIVSKETEEEITAFWRLKKKSWKSLLKPGSWGKRRRGTINITRSFSPWGEQGEKAMPRKSWEQGWRGPSTPWANIKRWVRLVSATTSGKWCCNNIGGEQGEMLFDCGNHVHVCMCTAVLFMPSGKGTPQWECLLHLKGFGCKKHI